MKRVTMEPGIRGLDALTRRQALRGAVGGGMALSASGLLVACGGDDGGGGGGGTPATSQSSGDAELKTGGILRVGATGGGPEDSIDAHRPTSDPDIMRVWNMYESLAVRTPDFEELEMLLAESIEAGKTPKVWDIRLKPGLDVPQRQAGDRRRRDLLAAPDRGREGPQGRRRLDRLHRRSGHQEARRPHACASRCSSPTPASPTTSGSTSTRSSRPTTTPRSPVGTGPFKFDSFTPGEREPLR